MPPDSRPKALLGLLIIEHAQRSALAHEPPGDRLVAPYLSVIAQGRYQLAFIRYKSNNINARPEGRLQRSLHKIYKPPADRLAARVGPQSVSGELRSEHELKQYVREETPAAKDAATLTICIGICEGSIDSAVHWSHALGVPGRGPVRFPRPAGPTGPPQTNHSSLCGAPALSAAPAPAGGPGAPLCTCTAALNYTLRTYTPPYIHTIHTTLLYRYTFNAI
ncbi:unnamed protein product [Danaus chrysippus]|uniref:(African queen) hypothetical protein n=1 Tax=Danaus chrysippus TaxID=151541 RepID=A0A8J2QR94_9NEOP|nr:unnamed protein product [Danaus chrysippus]